MGPNSAMKTLPLIPLDDVVVFPGMNLTLAIDPGAEEEVLLVPRSGDDFAAVGTVARVDEQVRLPGGGLATGFEGLHRGVAGAARTDLNGTLRIEV
ncbi:MAG: endopeptidase La, partial [Acidobacteria bacterium]